MRKPVVDYREFRLSKLGSPQFSHLKLLIGWVGYFALYFLTENLIPADKCFIIHSRLDDLIPFCEAFVIPYVSWYFLIVFSLIYFALYNVESFKKLQIFIIITQVSAMAIYILFPNMQDLRPEVFPRENFLTEIVKFLYFFDTDTNVFPSLHVAYSIGIASVWVKEYGVNKLWKWAIVVWALLICASTAIIKQHSVLDGFAAIPICILAEIIVFHRKKANKNSKSADA